MMNTTQNIDFQAARETGDWSEVDSAIESLFASTAANKWLALAMADVDGPSFCVDFQAARQTGDWLEVDSAIESRFGNTAMVVVEQPATAVIRKRG
jgi:hypothetical protein